MSLAHLPAEQKLTEEQKLASPYGLNVHSGAKIVVNPYKKAGLVWFREYAFAYDWLLRAKGDDMKYAGWPYYPQIVNAYTDAGVKCLPVIQKSLTPPAVTGGKVTGRIGPDKTWTREIASVVMAFPQITHWELSNEYDLPADNLKPEELRDWANYRAFHKQFANILEIVGGGELTAVENGRAGIWPERLLRCVQSGDFDKIGVVNVHHYCGTDAPETNVSNFNMGSESKLPALLFDELRTAKRAGQADGKPRQCWLTEFGWDTLAGPAVSPYEQAVFLPREWMLAMSAGIDKAFWFYNFDAAEPKQFFDGCGLLDAKGEPKLSLCSLAGLTSVLPSPHYVGDLNAGPNTCGYVFEDGGKLVAALWSIKGDDGPTVKFNAEQLKDFLGNPMAGQSAKLTMAPVYAIGLNKSDVWYKQTAYSLESPHLVPAAAGDVVHPKVRVTNHRAEAIACQVNLTLPAGWQAEQVAVSASVAPGATQDLELPFTIPFAEAIGFKDIKLTVSERRGTQADATASAGAIALDRADQPDGGPARQDPGDGHGRQSLDEVASRHIDDARAQFVESVDPRDRHHRSQAPGSAFDHLSVRVERRLEAARNRADHAEFRRGQESDAVTHSQPVRLASSQEHQDWRQAKRLDSRDPIAGVDARLDLWRCRRHRASGLGAGRFVRRGPGARLEAASQRPQKLLGRRHARAVFRLGRQQARPRGGGRRSSILVCATAGRQTRLLRAVANEARDSRDALRHSRHPEHQRPHGRRLRDGVPAARRPDQELPSESRRAAGAESQSDRPGQASHARSLLAQRQEVRHHGPSRSLGHRTADRVTLGGIA